MAMSLPVQIAIHNAAYTSAVGAAKNNSSTPEPEQVQEICAACGQVIETATEYTAGEMLVGIVVGALVMGLIAFGLVMFADWLFDRI